MLKLAKQVDGVTVEAATLLEPLAIDMVSCAERLTLSWRKKRLTSQIESAVHLRLFSSQFL
jgi:hypothetical protein